MISLKEIEVALVFIYTHTDGEFDVNEVGVPARHRRTLSSLGYFSQENDTAKLTGRGELEAERAIERRENEARLLAEVEALRARVAELEAAQASGNKGE